MGVDAIPAGQDRQKPNPPGRVCLICGVGRQDKTDELSSTLTLAGIMNAPVLSLLPLPSLLCAVGEPESLARLFFVQTCQQVYRIAFSMLHSS